MWDRHVSYQVEVFIVGDESERTGRRVGKGNTLILSSDLSNTAP
jgi:hypothetical protein